MNAILEQINWAGGKFVEFALPMLVQSVVLILILLIIDFVLRKKLRAVFRYWIWLLVLAKLTLPTSLTSPFSLGYFVGDRLIYADKAEMSSEPQKMFTETSSVGIPPCIDLSNIQSGRFTRSVIPIIPNTEPLTESVISKVHQVNAKPSKASMPVTPLSWQGVLFLLWLVSVMVMILLLLQRMFFVRGLLRRARPANNLMMDALEYCQDRMAVRRKVRLKVSFNATSPAVCGLFRPMILLPQDLGPTLGSSHLRTVIMHELAHIKRGDLWVNTIQVVLQIFYLYNPLLWLANAIIRRVREQAADETVLVAMGPKAQQYPETLVNVARLAWQRPALSLRLIGVIESKSQLKERIRKMLDRPAPKSAKLGIAGILIIIALGAFLLPMAKAQNGEAETPKVSKNVTTEKEAEIKMLQDKIKELEKYLQKLQKQVQQKKSQIAVVETKSKEQSDLLKKDKQKAKKEKDESSIDEREILVKEVVDRIKLLEKLNNEQSQEAKEKDQSDEQIEQLKLILEQIKLQQKAHEIKQKADVERLKAQEAKEAALSLKEQAQAAKEKAAELLSKIRKKDSADVDNVDVVVVPKPMPKPTPKPMPRPHPVPTAIPATPTLTSLPKLPKITSPPIPKIPIEVDPGEIHVTIPRIEPPQDIVQQITKVHTERAALKMEISKLRKELDKRKELDNISDEEVEEFEQKIEALEQKQEMLDERSEELDNRMEAWSEQIRDKMDDWRQKFQEQMRQKLEQKNEEKLIQHEHQMREHERQMEQSQREMEQLEQQQEHEHEKELEHFEQQMKHFEQQMDQWAKQHGHQMEQWAQKFNQEMELSLKGLEAIEGLKALERLEDELGKIDVEVDVVIDENADAEADARADVVVGGSKDGKEKAIFTKGPNIITTPLDPGRKIIVKNRIGSINVTNGKAGQCSCSITVKASAETIEQARDKAKPVKIEVDEDDKALNLIVVKTDNDEWKDINVDLNIQVPLGSDIDVITDVGSIKMNNLEGKIQGKTDVGDIHVSNIQGNVKLSANVGKVVYEVPEEISAEVKASTDVGTIQTELPLDVIRNFQKSQLSGVLGNGRNKVDLRTKVGNITIRKAKSPLSAETPMIR
jgi:beta-lactamase regulating signal transducer with metallopeptidase domain